MAAWCKLLVSAILRLRPWLGPQTGRLHAGLATGARRGRLRGCRRQNRTCAAMGSAHVLGRAPTMTPLEDHPMASTTLFGFDGSTYVRTVKMVFVEKRFTDFTQVPVNVLAGEP